MELENPEKRMSLVDHLKEFRSRLIKSALAILIGMCGSWFLYNFIVEQLTKPFCPGKIAQNSSSHCGILYINGVLGPLNLKIEVTLLLAIFFAAPIWLYQIWAFVAPALHRKEKKYSLFFLLAGVPFFFTGAYLGYLLIPEAVKFLLGFTPNTLTNLVKIDEYLNFVLRVILIFGLAFELPIFLVALNFVGVLPGKSILKPWRFAVFGITFFAGLVVPTGDPLTMLALAVPMVFFYFLAGLIGIYRDKRVSRRVER